MGRKNHVALRSRPSARYDPVTKVTGGSSLLCKKLKRTILLSTGRGDVRIGPREALELIEELERAVEAHHTDGSGS